MPPNALIFIIFLVFGFYLFWLAHIFLVQAALRHFLPSFSSFFMGLLGLLLGLPLLLAPQVAADTFPATVVHPLGPIILECQGRSTLLLHNSSWQLAHFATPEGWHPAALSPAPLCFCPLVLVPTLCHALVDNRVSSSIRSCTVWHLFCRKWKVLGNFCNVPCDLRY